MTRTATVPIAVQYVTPAAPTLRVPVPCACCGQPVAFVVVAAGTLALEICSRHHGDKHVNVLTLGDVAALVRATGG